MRRSLIPVLGLALLVLLAGCGGDEASISEDLADLGTTELMEQTADDHYEAPEDGRLTDSQIQMYLKVRDHEKKIAQVARQELEQHAKKAEEKGDKSLAGLMSGFKALGSVADALTADIRAAHELGYNTAEYRWVKEKVLEASGAAFQETMAKSMNQMMDQGYADMKKQFDKATDPDHKKALGEFMAQYEKGRQEMAAEQGTIDPAVRHNRELLAKYESELNAVAQELAKWESEPGQADKALQEWQQKAAGQ